MKDENEEVLPEIKLFVAVILMRRSPYDVRPRYERVDDAMAVVNREYGPDGVLEVVGYINDCADKVLGMGWEVGTLWE